MLIEQNDMSLTLRSAEGDYMGLIVVSPGGGYEVELNAVLTAQELRQITHAINNFMNRVVIIPARM